MITIARYLDANRAVSDQAFLEGSGIPVFLKDENSAFLGSAAVGLANIQLQTDPAHAARARELLGLENEDAEADAAETTAADLDTTSGLLPAFAFVILTCLLAGAISLLADAPSEAWLGIWLLTFLGLLILMAARALLRRRG